MRALSLLALGALTLTGCFHLIPWTAPGLSKSDSAPVRVVAIPREENGYKYFQSQVINSREEFDTFIATVDEPRSWNNRAGFLAAVEEAMIDFAQESLVLIREGDGSGSDTVTLAEPQLHGGTLTCTVRILHPGTHTRDMQYRCFAVIVKRSRVREVEVRVRTGSATVLRETLVVSRPAKKLD